MKKKMGGDEERLLELAREKGLSGVRESEAMERSMKREELICSYSVTEVPWSVRSRSKL